MGNAKTPSQYHLALRLRSNAQTLSWMSWAIRDEVSERRQVSAPGGRRRAPAKAYGYNEARVRYIPFGREIAQADTVADWPAWPGMHHGGVARLSVVGA
jgi:hypothetical protein